MTDSFAQFQKQFRDMQHTIPNLEQSRAYTPNNPIQQNNYPGTPIMNPMNPMNTMNTMNQMNPSMMIPQSKVIQDQATAMKQYEELNAKYGSVDKEKFIPPRILLYNRKTYPFDPANLVFGQCRKHPRGSKVCDAAYHLVVPEEKIDVMVSPIYIELPASSSVFGLTESKYQADRWSIDLALNQTEYYPVFQALFLWDQRIVEMVGGKPMEFFGDPRVTPSNVADMYNYMSKLKINKETNTWFAPRLSLKVPMKNGKLDIVVYDENRHLTSQKMVGAATGRKYVFVSDDNRELEIGRRAQIRVIFKMGGLWFTNKSFTMSNPICQVQILPRPSGLDGFAFSDPTPDDENIPTLENQEPAFSV